MHTGFYHISRQKITVCWNRFVNTENKVSRKLFIVIYMKETIYSNSNILPLHQDLPKQLGLLRCLDGTLNVRVGQNTSLSQRSKYFYVLYSLYHSFKNSEFGKSAGSILSSCCFPQHWPNLLPEEGGLEGFSPPENKWSQLELLIMESSKLTSFDFSPRLRIRVDHQLRASV